MPFLVLTSYYLLISTAFNEDHTACVPLGKSIHTTAPTKERDVSSQAHARNHHVQLTIRVHALRCLYAQSLQDARLIY